MTKEEYQELREKLCLTKTEFSRVFNYGEGKQPYGYKVVHEKEHGERIISRSDTAICNLIKIGLKLAPKTVLRIVKIAAKK